MSIDQHENQQYLKSGHPHAKQTWTFWIFRETEGISFPVCLVYSGVL